MILSFPVFREKLEDGTKCQTIRRFSPKQYQRFLNTWKKRETTGRYNLYWHNPRNGGVRIKDVVPSDKPTIIQFNKEHKGIYVVEPDGRLLPMSWDYIAQTIQDDGFDSKDDMFLWFSLNYGDAMFTEKFMVIRWHP